MMNFDRKEGVHVAAAPAPLLIMSDQEQSKLEEGSKLGLSEKHKDGHNSVRIRSFILVILLMGVIIFCLMAFGWIMIALYLLVIIIVIVPLIANAIKQKGYLLVNVIAISVDPLFYYYPVLKNDWIYIKWDNRLGITATVIRSFLDFLKLVYYIYELRRAYNKQDEKERIKISLLRERITISLLREKFLNFFKGKGRDLLENEAVRFWMLFLIDIFAVLPIPQVLVISGTCEAKFSNTMAYFLLQYLVRVIRTYFLFTKATGDSGILADATWAIVAFYILLYMQGGHVFGALWYYYAIEKRSSCQNKNKIDCINLAVNTTSNYFGIYKDALLFDIVEETDFLKKLLRCLNWGLKNLSAFGQNLETSNDVGENIYAICMTIIGVVLFVFLIGKMQSDTTKSHKINEKWQQIRQWPHFKKITDDVKEQIRKDKRNNWQNKRVKVDSLLSDLSEDTAREVKHQFGLDLLKKVFKNSPESLLKKLCDYLKPLFIVERTCIIREGDPIDEMIFVLEGKILTYSNASRNETPRDVDFFGEELIDWALNESSSSKLPISTKTYQAYTNVEAFTLMACDLKRVSLFKHLGQAAHKP